MHSFGLFAVALLIAPVFGAPSRIQVLRVPGEKQQDSYIVKLKKGADKKATLSWLKSRLGPDSSVTYDYDSRFINGFAGKFCSQTLEALTANKDVESISEDAVYTIQANSTTQNDATWGLQRISQREKLNSTDSRALTYDYTYDPRAGEGVDVYVLDTGININHVGFGGRASWGYSAVGGKSDGHGHGTHCAGTVASTQFGVAKKAKVIAVKVLSDTGSGSTSAIVSGINWVVNQTRTTRRPSVISMSLGGEADDILDTSVSAAVDAGVHVVVAAGNSNVDAADTSPARVPSVITVGATTISDTRASFSNFGPVLDIFAPGQNITSTWIGSTTAVNTISGTSMATPHVAGAVAYLLSIFGQETPAAMVSRLKGLCVPTVSGAPAGTTDCLLQIPSTGEQVQSPLL